MSLLDDKFKNHFTVIIQNIFVILMIMGIMIVSLLEEGTTFEGAIPVLLGTGVLGLLWSLYCIIAWSRTNFYVTDEEIIKEYKFIGRSKKVVNFNKVASVNIRRTFFNRIFGTSTVLVNVNSSVNAGVPEISFVLKKDLANVVKDELAAKMYGLNYTSEKEEVYGSVVEFSNKDSILHGLLGNSSSSILISLGSIVFTIIFFTYDLAEIGLLLILSVVSMAVTMISLIIRYYNFRVYRLGDTIYLSHGAIQLYTTSFKVNKINAVKIKRTLFARMLGKASIEVEVVGLNTEGSTPVLCILTSMENVQKIIDEVVPDFKYDVEGLHQPKVAAYPWLMKAFLGSAATAFVALLIIGAMYNDREVLEYFDISIELAVGAVIACFIVLAIVYFGLAHLAFNSHKFDLGDDTFLVQFGVLDHTRAIIQYDRVQSSDVSSMPMPRRLGLARINVSLLSSMGKMKIQSGYFERDMLDKVSDIVLERLANGKYDYRKLI